jgi:hypothetical protein
MKVLKIGMMAMVLSCGLVAGAFAQVTFSVGFALSTTDASVKYTSGGSETVEGHTGYGGNAYLDYLLPVGIPLSLGAELGYDTGKVTIYGDDDTVAAIPVLIRAAYHFDLMPRLDLYLVGKLGYSFGSWTGPYKDYAAGRGVTIEDPSGVAFGFDIGAAFYVTASVGVFAEAGFDNYALEAEAKASGEKVATFEAPFKRFLTLGLSFKR